MKLSTKTIVTVGMFTAILSVLSILAFPMPSGVPVTLQTFAMAICGYVLGWKRGTAAALLYIVVGTVGIPVFAGMTGGPNRLVGPTGGFIWGFVFLTLLCGLAAMQSNIPCRIVIGLAGLAICHILGALQYTVVASVPLPASFLTVSVPYLIKDVISVLAACFVALPVCRALRMTAVTG